MLALEYDGLLGEGRPGGGDVVHAEPARECRRDDERYPDIAGVLQPYRERAVAFRDHDGIAAEPAEDAGRDDDGHKELRDADAEVAEAGVQRERVALLALREEERDVRHGG